MRSLFSVAPLVCSSIYNGDVGSGYGSVLSELSGGGLGGSGIGDDEIAAELGLDSLGDGDEDIGAKIARKAVNLVQRGASPAQVQAVVRRAVQAERHRGFQLLSSDPTSAKGAFGMSGSLCLLSFTGTVGAGATVALAAVTLDRKSTLRQLRCDAASTALRVTNFQAAGLPFTALQFPYSMAKYGPLADTHDIRAMSFDANSRFVLTLQNLTGADIAALVEVWGTPG